jgi:hypothetical protein
VQTATAQSQTGIDVDSGVAEAPSIFQAGWSDYIFFSLSLFVSVAHLEFPIKFLYL